MVEDRVPPASFHLEGEAQLWFLKLERDQPYLVWTDFKHFCHLRFGQLIHSNKSRELCKLNQMDSVADYQWQFDLISTQVGARTPEQVKIFISELMEYIAVEVELQHLLDLTTTIKLACYCERRAMHNWLSPVFRVEESLALLLLILVV